MLIKVIIFLVGILIGILIGFWMIPNIGDLIVFDEGDGEKGIIQFAFKRPPEDLLDESINNMSVRMIIKKDKPQ